MGIFAKLSGVREKTLQPGRPTSFWFRILSSRVVWKWTLVALVPLLMLLGFLFGIDALGRWTRAEIKDAERFQVSFADIDCSSPPSLSRDAFLAEVRTNSGIPEQLSILADDTIPRLRASFLQHPWVDSVQSLEVLPGPVIHLDLKFRTPILVVIQAGRRLVIDADCFVLPDQGECKDLPLYISPVFSSKGVVGTRWNDASLAQAAQLVAFFSADPDLPRLATVQHYVDDLVLTTWNGLWINWGLPIRNLTTAHCKRDQLRKRLQQNQKTNAADPNYDLRSFDQR